MNQSINVRIEVENNKSIEENSFALQKLEKDIEHELNIPITVERKKGKEGSMSGDMVVAIELAKISLAALGILWSVLQVRYRGQVTIEKQYPNGKKIVFTKSHLTDAELLEEIAKQEEEIEDQNADKIIIKLP